MMMAREQVIPWRKTALSEREEAGSLGFLGAWVAPLAGTWALIVPAVAQAAEATAKAAPDLMARLDRAFQPILQAIGGVSYHVCLIMVMGGGLCIIAGRRELGIKIIKDAAIGFILLQFSGPFMEILKAVAAAMRGN